MLSARIPVYNLTPSEAVEELAKIMDSKPDDDAILDLIHWHRDNDARVLDLHAWIMMHPPKEELSDAEEPKEPETEANPMPVVQERDCLAGGSPDSDLPELQGNRDDSGTEVEQAKDLAETKMTQLFNRLHWHIKKAQGSIDSFSFKKTRSQVNMLRYQIRHSAGYNKATMEPLPGIPEGFWENRTAKTKPAPIRKASFAPPPPPPPPTEKDAPAMARQLRRDLWELLMRIEDMPNGDRKNILKDVELIEAQATEAIRIIKESE